LEARERLEVVLKLEYMRVLQMDRQGLGESEKNGGFRKQMYQHRGSGLDIVSSIARNREH
jgi:hypothetical protein